MTGRNDRLHPYLILCKGILGYLKGQHEQPKPNDYGIAANEAQQVRIHLAEFHLGLGI
jgi:hypothetical protein